MQICRYVAYILQMSWLRKSALKNKVVVNVSVGRRVSVSLNWKYGDHISRRRIRKETIDQEGSLTLIAGNTRGSSAERWSNETGVIYRLSPTGSSRWLADEDFGSAWHSCPLLDLRSVGVQLAWRQTSLMSRLTDIAGRLLIGNEIEQELLTDGLLAQCPEDACFTIKYAQKSPAAVK